MSWSKAVIVAAGQSTRLLPLTADCPKPLLEVAGEKLLLRQIRLLRACGVRDILVICGFQRKMMEAALAGSGATLCFNPFFRICNNMGSLWLAREWAAESPFLYLHGDLFYAPVILESFLASDLFGHSLDLLVDPGPVDEEAMKVLARDGLLVESSKAIKPSQSQGEWLGIAKVYAQGFEPLFAACEELLRAGKLQDYDTSAFSAMASRHPIGIVPTGKGDWAEIEFLEDLERARGFPVP